MLRYPEQEACSSVHRGPRPAQQVGRTWKALDRVIQTAEKGRGFLRAGFDNECWMVALEQPVHSSQGWQFVSLDIDFHQAHRWQRQLVDREREHREAARTGAQARLVEV